MANVFATVLQRAGHRIVGIASNGREAVTMAMKERPELIVMDIHMPVLDGLQAASEILEDRLVPIILSTGLVDLKAIERANDIRGLSYLVKPFSSAQLHVAVHLAVTQCGALSESDARK
jgi:response regulator NasT